MNRLIVGMALSAFLMSPQIAGAEPANADLWIGVGGTRDGFLLDTGTGELWMTGICVKSLPDALQEGGFWRSDLQEMVSVGRGRTLLQQSFLLDSSDAAPSIVVDNPDRGGEQAIPGVVRIDCAAGDHCQRVLDAPTC
ncbi:MAG: hypothetical protein AAF253_03435 [Pseudomonadota bacterium]